MNIEEAHIIASGIDKELVMSEMYINNWVKIVTSARRMLYCVSDN